MAIRNAITRKNAYKLIKYQIILLSVLLNIAQAHAMYNVRCANTEHKTIAWFVTKEHCNDLVSDEIDARQYRINAAENITNNAIAADYIDSQRED